jgi:hypothetical protein
MTSFCERIGALFSVPVFVIGLGEPAAVSKSPFSLAAVWTRAPLRHGLGEVLLVVMPRYYQDLFSLLFILRPHHQNQQPTALPFSALDTARSCDILWDLHTEKQLPTQRIPIFENSSSLPGPPGCISIYLLFDRLGASNSKSQRHKGAFHSEWIPICICGYSAAHEVRCIDALIANAGMHIYYITAIGELLIARDKLQPIRGLCSGCSHGKAPAVVASCGSSFGVLRDWRTAVLVAQPA